MRKSGTVLGNDQLNYINHVIGKLYKLNQSNLGDIILTDNNILEQTSKSKFSDKAVVNNIPMYAVNGLSKLKNIKQTVVHTSDMISFKADDRTYTKVIKAPDGFSGNQSYISSAIELRNGMEMSFVKHDMAPSITIYNAMENLTQFISHGSLSINIAKHDKEVVITHRCSKDIEFKVFVDYAKSAKATVDSFQVAIWGSFYKEGGVN